MIKKELPILEFDESKVAHIEPRIKSKVSVPNRLVITFFREVIEKLVEDKKISPLTGLQAEDGELVIYKYVDYDCLIIQGKLGAPASAGLNIDYIKGKTWTTDAFYRETKEKIKLRKEEGCVIVEMEQSALLAVSQFRGIEYGAIIYGGDDLSRAVWDNREWQSRTDVRTNLIDICREIVLKM
ncbi:hypothetical protein KHQ81_02795 [Mycoplasmatota bacterium]|nr:hypothetical protein KHQ81_02795 [Mycoplasmatota bacterium]